MPNFDPLITLTNTSDEVLNAIRNSASTDFRNYTKVVRPDAGSIREFGAVLADYPFLMNEFCDALANRIGLTFYDELIMSVDWSFMKRGMLPYGSSIQEVFVDLLKPHQYDPAIAEAKIFEREKPDVYSQYHIVNFKKFYKVSIDEEELSAAFLSQNGVIEFIQRVIGQLAKSAALDEWYMMKYMIAYAIVKGQIKPLELANGADIDSALSTFRATANMMSMPTTEYNRSGVVKDTAWNDMYVILDANFDAAVDVVKLAASLHLSYADFLGRRVLTNGFKLSDTEKARVAELLDDGVSLYSFSATEDAALEKVAGVIIDKYWSQIYDVKRTMRTADNGEGLYRNYWLHVWKVFSTSLFQNAAAIAEYGTGAVGSLSISPATATLSIGDTLQLVPTWTGNYYSDPTILYSSSAPAKVSVDARGFCTVLSGSNNDTVTITGKSAADGTVTDTCVITLSVS